MQDVHQGYGGDAVHHRVMQPHQEDRVAALMALDDRDPPERMVSVKPLTEQLPDEGREHAVVARRGHRDLFDMAIEVEVGVVLPRRIREAQGRGYHALAIAREQVQPGSEQLDELIAREVPLVDHALADVHWLVAPLPVQEDRIVEAQAPVRGVVGDGRSSFRVHPLSEAGTGLRVSRFHACSAWCEPRMAPPVAVADATRAKVVALGGIRGNGMGRVP